MSCRNKSFRGLMAQLYPRSTSIDIWMIYLHQRNPGTSQQIVLKESFLPQLKTYCLVQLVCFTDLLTRKLITTLWELSLPYFYQDHNTKQGQWPRKQTWFWHRKPRIWANGWIGLWQTLSRDKKRDTVLFQTQSAIEEGSNRWYNTNNRNFARQPYWMAGKWKLFALERTFVPMGKRIYCSCHLTWLPGKTSMVSYLTPH